MLGQLTREEQADSGLDLARGDGRLLVVLGQAGGLGGNALEDVVHKRVHDGHGLGADAGVGVHLLEHLEDVDGIALLALLVALALGAGGGLGLAGLLLSLLAGLGRHGKDQCFTSDAKVKCALATRATCTRKRPGVGCCTEKVGGCGRKFVKFIFDKYNCNY